MCYWLQKQFTQKFVRLRKKNLKARAAKGSLLSIIGFVVIKAEDQSKTNISGNILTIPGLISYLIYNIKYY